MRWRGGGGRLLAVQASFWKWKEEVGSIVLEQINLETLGLKIANEKA